mmetsp:Transcript_28788/g.50260  ORF Transcript_28788/g.50260 Transcript_28788/m.50260 type:complete len:242 (+) Transcript_28788:1106-1831(+)
MKEEWIDCVPSNPRDRGLFLRHNAEHEQEGWGHFQSYPCKPPRPIERILPALKLFENIAGGAALVVAMTIWQHAHTARDSNHPEDCNSQAKDSRHALSLTGTVDCIEGKDIADTEVGQEAQSFVELQVPQRAIEVHIACHCTQCQHTHEGNGWAKVGPEEERRQTPDDQSLQVPLFLERPEFEHGVHSACKMTQIWIQERSENDRLYKIDPQQCGNNKTLDEAFDALFGCWSLTANTTDEA